MAAGEDLAAGEALPIGIADGSAMGAAVSAGAGEAARQAWTSAGFDEADAEQLAQVWGLGDTKDAEVAGGSKPPGW